MEEDIIEEVLRPLVDNVKPKLEGCELSELENPLLDRIELVFVVEDCVSPGVELAERPLVIKNGRL